MFSFLERLFGSRGEEAHPSAAEVNEERREDARGKRSAPPALKDWLSTLPAEQRERAEGYLDHLPDRNRGWALTQAAGYAKREDRALAVLLSRRAIEVAEEPVDKHFAYNHLIQTLWSEGRKEEAVNACLEEVQEFDAIRPSLVEALHGELPPSVPARDYLLDNIGDEALLGRPAEQILDLLLDKGLVSADEIESIREEQRIEERYSQALDLIRDGQVAQGTALLDDLTVKTQLGSARAQTVGEALHAAGQDRLALEWYQRALEADPTASGFRRDMRRLASELDREDQLRSRWIRALEQAEGRAEAWWRKRDLAVEFSKLGLYDQAWALFQEAKLARWEDGGPADTIIPEMARSLEREGRYNRALSTWLLARRAALQAGGRPRASVKDGVDRCLKRLELEHSAEELLDEVTASMTPEEVQDLSQRYVG